MSGDDSTAGFSIQVTTSDGRTSFVCDGAHGPAIVFSSRLIAEDVATHFGRAFEHCAYSVVERAVKP